MIRSDIHFRTDDSHRFLPWLVGIMAGLAALLLCIGISVNAWVVNRGGEYGNSFTVNIPAGENQQERAAAAQAALKKISGIERVSEISSARLHDLLKPWLGSGDLGDLPLPIVLEVTLTKPSLKVNFPALQKALSAVAPGTEVDAHDRWVEAFSNFSSAVHALTALLAALIIGAVIATIAFAARTSLKLHGKTVHLLHSIGAGDGYITRQFQQEALKLVAPAAALGCLAAGIIYWAIGAYVASLNISLLPPLAIAGAHIWLLALLPVACAALGWAVTYVSIAMQLERSL